jgi:integral membrane protein
VLSNAATRLRYASVLEAVSFLLLLVATLLKYTGPEEEVGVTVLGPVHGALFVLYVVLALDVWRRRRWSLGRAVVVLGASVLPVAPLLVESRMLRQDEAALARTPRDAVTA